MRLYVGPMDAVLVEFDDGGRVRFDGEDWSAPTLQERRALLYAAESEVAELRDLIEVLERACQPSPLPDAAPHPQSRTRP